MADLHPEVLALIAAGRKRVVAPEHIGMELIERLETPEEFARRIAEEAVSKCEQEYLAAIEMSDMTSDINKILAAIRRRGKP